MERRIDVTHKMVLELVPKTTEYLQPNPAYRPKLGMLNTVSRIRGQVKAVGYPQTEGMLGDCMLHYGRELGVGSAFGCALADIGEALKQMAIARDSLDISVKNNFIDPLQALQDKELREIGYHLRKLEGRRLDFDYKKEITHDCEVFLDQPCCRALYRFVAENEGELGFKEGDLIILTNQIDDNWYEGMISGESGFFPISYVNVLVPLPQSYQGSTTSYGGRL
ncbi:endophilin-A3b [Salvelinus namaycush]|uniref:Endophilin-A3b n=1 Tax=Salvelinus namaycush TaxID=8040 RepID=A0A8U1FAQ1_SALNM|nr:endophilin-A3b [Salvelinus namaycush]